MNFREASVSDIPFIVGLLRDFDRKLGPVYGSRLDDASAVQTLARIIISGICIVGPTSVAGAVLQPWMWNRSVVFAEVAFWTFKNAREILIFDELLRRCKEAGATHVAVQSHFPHHRIARFYAKRQLTPCETSHIKAL